jgi:hypothetical protein
MVSVNRLNESDWSKLLKQLQIVVLKISDAAADWPGEYLLCRKEAMHPIQYNGTRSLTDGTYGFLRAQQEGDGGPR